jgi:uncharacterized protein YbjT (DUF2867 family)
MLIIMGATGNVGGTVAETLLEKREPVSVVTHNPESADDLRAKGAEVLVADINDVPPLRAAFKKGKRASFEPFSQSFGRFRRAGKSHDPEHTNCT